MPLAEVGVISSCLLALLVCLDGEAGTPSPLVGLPNGLDGRSDVWLICDGRLANGFVFSGDKEPGLVGDRLVLLPLRLDFNGEVCGGGVPRAVAGEALLFWRLKGDWRPESKERGDGRCAWDGQYCIRNSMHVIVVPFCSHVSIF